MEFIGLLMKTLKTMGFTNPAEVRIFGNGGTMLP